MYGLNLTAVKVSGLLKSKTDRLFRTNKTDRKGDEDEPSHYDDQNIFARIS